MQIRAHQCAPLFKMYILNGDEAFFGLYPLVKHVVPLAGWQREMYDLRRHHELGYADKPGKHERMTQAGAGAVITSMADLALSLRAHQLIN